jgi:hypothetical protein
MLALGKFLCCIFAWPGIISPFPCRTQLSPYSSHLLQILRKRALQPRIQPLLHNPHNPAAMPLIRIPQILPHPRLDVGNLRKRVARRFLARIELGEADAEAELVDVNVRDDVVCGGRDGGVDHECDEALGGEGPALGVAVDEGLRVAEGFCEGYDGGFAVGGAGEFLGVGEDYGEVDGFEDAVEG